LKTRLSHSVTMAQDPMTDVSALEAESDPRVYARDGLSAEEIRIVEDEGGTLQ